MHTAVFMFHLLTDQFGFRRSSFIEHVVAFITDNIRININEGCLTETAFKGL